jgi:hypothetical protein
MGLIILWIHSNSIAFLAVNSSSVVCTKQISAVPRGGAGCLPAGHALDVPVRS